MRLDGGLIGSLELTHTPSGKVWILRRSWNNREVRGVEFHDLPSHSQLLRAWKKLPDTDHQDTWHLELPQFDPDATPSLRSLETLEHEVARYRKSKGKLPADVAARLDESISQIGRIAEAFEKSDKAIGFFCPASVHWISDQGVLLADAGFVWNSGLAAGLPPWLQGDDGARHQFRDFWDLSPKEINYRLMKGTGLKEVAEHDQRVLARMIAWLLLGGERLIREEGKSGFNIPDSDSSPEIQRAPFFKTLASIVNLRKPIPWNEFFSLFSNHPPSRFFEPAPPPPPVDFKPLIRRTVVIGALLVLLGAGWAYREKFWPAPPPPLKLCPTCPGSSQLRKPADELASLWESSSPPTPDQLGKELEHLELAHQAPRTPQLAAREEECLSTLRDRFDERLGVAASAVIEELTGNPPNSDEACRRLNGVHRLAQRLDALAKKSDSNNVKNPIPQQEPALWRRKIDSLVRSYHCP
jgi:hypothetical protein